MCVVGQTDHNVAISEVFDLSGLALHQVGEVEYVLHSLEHCGWIGGLRKQSTYTTGFMSQEFECLCIIVRKCMRVLTSLKLFGHTRKSSKSCFLSTVTFWSYQCVHVE